MVPSESGPAVGEMIRWFPSVLGVGVAFPLDKVLVVLPAEDAVDLEGVGLLRLEVEGSLNRCRGVRWLKERNMEDGVYVGVVRELESVVLRSSLFDNQEWSDLDMVQFFGHSSCSHVPGREVYFIPPF